jgi:Cu(I)/Ag(I) efflux system membrane fusion protein
VRAAGRVAWDETTLHDVTVRVGGFVGSVKADALGMRVERGQVLFELYGPELYAAQREYLEALRSRRAAGSVSSRASDLAGAAERRLRLWGLESGDVAAIARSGVPREYLPIRAPITGYVVEKDVVDGAAVEMGQRVYRIASLDRVWIEAEVYEAELAEVAIGTPATVELAYLPGRRFDAKVAWVQPSLDPERRTARVRLVVENPDGALRPDMYATVAIERPSEPRLSVPDSAVLRAGTRSFVFLDLGDGRLRPAPVEIGATRGGRVEILGGLEAGQRVVTRGTFLVSGESRLRAALETW